MMVVVARIEGTFSAAKVAFRDHPKGSDRRQRATVFGVQLVRPIAVVQHNLALQAARQVEAIDKRVSWVVVPISIPVTIAFAMALVLVPITRVVPPGVVNAIVLTRIAVTVTWIDAVDHTR